MRGMVSQKFFLLVPILLWCHAGYARSQTTTEAVTDPYVAPDESTVAMIIGGSWNEASRMATMASVELFGCPGYEKRSFPLEDFPHGVYLSGATYFPNKQDVGKVVVCGGFQCADGAIDNYGCELSKRCFEWTLDSGSWTQTPDLNGSKWSYLMTLVQNLDEQPDELVPMAIGGGDEQTGIYDPVSREWTLYHDIPSSEEDWVTLNCFIQIGDNIYYIGNRFYELNTLTWEITRELDVPEFLRQPGMCSQARVRDIEGILLTNGYWFNLHTEEWEQLQFPPFPDFLPFELTNLMMYSFRGKPTIFNMPTCDAEEQCIFNDIVQYDSSYDQWESIGTLLHNRGFSSVVEVPREYCDVARYDPPSQRTAAIILGGISDPDMPSEGDNLLRTAELFGCSRSISIPLEDFPEGIYLTGGVHFVLDEEDDPYGKVMVCGGYTDRIDNRCWELDPNTMSWSEASYTLQGSRWSHEMVLSADLSSGSNKRVPMVLGGQKRESEVWDPITDTWKPYDELPLEQGDYWTSTECLAVYQDKVYHIRDHLYSLDLFSWELTDHGEVPNFVKQPGRCQIAEINKVPGIMIKNGYWYNLATSEWEAKRFPPHPPSFTEVADAFYSFRGSPTIFGSPVCDENGECEYREVLWYDSHNDIYVSLGNMREQRFNHEVIEVPDSFCDLVDNVDPTTEGPFTGNTEQPPLRPEVDEESVVLITGGHFNHPDGAVALAATELFGCKDSVDPKTGEYIGKQVDDVPVAVYLTGGVYYEEAGVDETGRGKAVLCGGFACPSGTVSCQASEACYQWTPSEQWEPFDSNLINEKWAHIMVNGPNLDSSHPDNVPIVLGENKQTEVFDSEKREWVPYRDLSYSDWNAIQCLVQYGDYVYQIGGSTSSLVQELNLNTWTTRSIGEKPDFITQPGTCAIAVIRDVPGIMIANGYWFNIVEQTWESKRFPPYFVDFLQPNSMANFRGKATIFGSQYCDSNGQCDYTAVYQYDGSEDQWKYLGRTIHSRTLHEIIEVPKTFCDVVKTPPESSETAAMVIGGLGVFGEDGRRQIHKSVELFGCPGKGSFFIEDYPVRHFSSAGNYFEVLDRDEEETSGTVLVCGGYLYDDPHYGLMSECYEWTPQDKWSSKTEMDRERWHHIMASVVDLSSGSNVPVPLALGVDNTTSIYDYVTDIWMEYNPLSEKGWDSTDCLIQHEDTIYHIRTQVQSLNTLTWETLNNGQVPEILANHPGRCAISVINGETGIFMRNGFWFNLETKTWEAKRFPPYTDITDEPNELFSYQGRPTMFGSPMCDGQGNCEYREVLQYNEVTDSWDNLGSMIESRQLHAVVEVPQSFCDLYSNVNKSPKLTPEVTQQEDEEVETVAMVVGGYVDGQIIPNVELFGCPDSPDRSKILQDYPENVYLSGGKYFQDMEMVISCGGYSCQDISCTILNDCFQWTPEKQWQPFESNLNYNKWSHLMAQVDDIDSSDDSDVPMVIGQNSITEIWDPNQSIWKRYRDSPGFNWISVSCLIQEGEYIYHIGADIERLDTSTWTLEVLGTVPNFLDSSGKCSYMEMNGAPGILLGNGYWYNIEENVWQQQRFPPYANVAEQPNALFNFHGKPTIFGSTMCDGDGTCIYTGVEQYDVDTNTWVHLGRMLQTREFHDVIEVPVSYCDFDKKPLLSNSAAIIVGGVGAGSNQGIFSSVELFGCPGEENTIPGPEFPMPLYYTGGTYYSEDGSVENGSVIVCGGFGCPPDGNSCNILDICYEYNPLKSDDWVETSPLVSAKWAHIMITAPDVDSVSNQELPLVLGFYTDTQIRDFDTKDWRNYKELPEGSDDYWLSFGCLVRYRYKVYQIREEISELDTLLWELNNLGPVPEFMTNDGAGPGRCAITEIDKKMGIMLRNGFFYQLDDKTWNQKKFPPHIAPRIGLPSESLFTFRGMPTYFGGPTCDENVDCQYTEILQYQDQHKDWIKLGNMAASRIDHEVIEIPAEFCPSGSATTGSTTTVH